MRKHVMGLLNGLLPSASLAMLCLLAGCSGGSPGGEVWDGLDRSGSIYLAGVEDVPVAQLTDLTVEEQDFVKGTIHPIYMNGAIAVGYEHWPSAQYPPEFNADCREFWSSPTAFLTPALGFSWGVTIDGDEGVYNATYSSGDLGVTEMTMRAEFSVAGVQNALDQQFSRTDSNMRTEIDPANRLRVPITWTVSGEINGKAFSLDFTEQTYVTCNY